MRDWHAYDSSYPFTNENKATLKRIKVPTIIPILQCAEVKIYAQLNNFSMTLSPHTLHPHCGILSHHNAFLLHCEEEWIFECGSKQYAARNKLL